MAEISEALHPVVKRGGGPRTDEGKKRSSQNAVKHGCRSKKKLLKGESWREYRQVWARWAEEYLPMTEVELELVEMLVDCAWRLKRAGKTLLEAEAEAKAARGEERGPAQAMVMLQQRYRTTAENSFYKAMRVLDARRAQEKAEVRQRRHDAARERFEIVRMRQIAPDKVGERLHAATAEIDKLNTATPSQRVFRGQLHKRARRRPVVLEQTVNVREVDGQTVTTYEPTNDEMVAQGMSLLPPPDAVVRRFYFEDGQVPAEYEWAVPDPAHLCERREDGEPLVGEQWMTTDRWLLTAVEEAKREGGHAGPTGEGNYELAPSPGDEDDVCRCAACEVAREVGYFSKLKQVGPHREGRSVWSNARTRWEAGTDGVFG